MIRTLKTAFGLGLLAALSMAAMSVMSATAETNGHFTADVPLGEFAVLDIKEGTGTEHEVRLEGWGSTITCHEVKYTQATAAQPETPTVPQTTTEIKVTPDYSNCTRNNSSTAIVHLNGCHYVLTPDSVNTHATAHFVCPTGKRAEVTVPAVGSTMTFPPQTAKGVTYTTKETAGGIHWITADITATGLHGECHGPCALLGTTRTDVRMEGSLTVEGTNKETGAAVDITHT